MCVFKSAYRDGGHKANTATKELFVIVVYVAGLVSI